ncbi:MAG: hypothetical protein KDG50_14655 [Chromatiales bacterium]|nr:hypothetical protein [Chromatiales bacterium]
MSGRYALPCGCGTAVLAALAFAAFGSPFAAAAIFNVTSNADSGPGSLRAVIAEAVGNGGGNEIRFSPGLGSIVLTSGHILITEDLAIVGPPGRQEITANNASRIFLQGFVNNYPQPHLTLENLILRDGNTLPLGEFPSWTCIEHLGGAYNGYGGAVAACGDLTLVNCQILNSRANSLGGGIYVKGRLEITRSDLSGNTGGSAGGAYGGQVTVADSMFTNNRASTTGGGLRATSLEMLRSEVTGNEITGSPSSGGSYGGGGIYAGSAHITDSDISNNRASLGIGGVYSTGDLGLDRVTVSHNIGRGVRGQQAHIVDSVISSNAGGGVSAAGLTLERSTVSGNTLASAGGGVSATNAEIVDSALRDNLSSGHGGGVYASTVSLENSVVTGNRATYEWANGGGVYCRSCAISNSAIVNNESNGRSARGGGVFSDDSVVVSNATIAANDAVGARALAGGIYASGVVEIVSSTISHNSASRGGGGLTVEALDSFVVQSTILAANTSARGNFDMTGTSTPLPSTGVTGSLLGDSAAEFGGEGNGNIFTDEPMLGPLADNGCERPAGAPGMQMCVPTRALAGNSPALDAVLTNPAEPYDQRGAGFPRIVGAHTDIEAFESDGNGPIPEGFFHESPRDGATVSGIDVLRGWSCNADTLDYQIDDGPIEPLAHHLKRTDTEAVCWDTLNGYAALVNWNEAGDGAHELRIYRDGVVESVSNFTVATYGTDFLLGAQKTVTVDDFPQPGETTTLEWSQQQQNFGIADFEPAPLP